MLDSRLNPEERKPAMVSTQIDLLLEGEPEMVAGVIRTIGEILKDFAVAGVVYVMDSKEVEI